MLECSLFINFWKRSCFIGYNHVRLNSRHPNPSSAVFLFSSKIPLIQKNVGRSFSSCFSITQYARRLDDDILKAFRPPQVICFIQCSKMCFQCSIFKCRVFAWWKLLDAHVKEKLTGGRGGGWGGVEQNMTSTSIKYKWQDLCTMYKSRNKFQTFWWADDQRLKQRLVESNLSLTESTWN